MDKEIKIFLKNDLNEADYFSLPKENLLTLREFLLQLKKKDIDFMSSIQEQFDSIKKKCNWLTSISFSGVVYKDGNYASTAIYLDAEDGIDLIAAYNNINNKYEGLAKDFPKIYLISKKIRKHMERQKYIDIIQEELFEIEKIGRDIYKDISKPMKSASGKFTIHYDNLGLSVDNGYDTIAWYFNSQKKYKYKDEEFLKDNKSKEKLLKKILVNPNNY